MLTQRIETDLTFNFVATVESHGWYQLDPFDYYREHGVLSRIQRLKDGRIALMHVEHREGGGLLVTTEGHVTEVDSQEIETLVRYMLCMDWKLGAFYALTNSLSDYQWVEERGAGRLLRSPSIWEDLTKILLTTNTIWSQTVEMVKKLMTLGDKSPFGYAFPTPQQVIARDVASLTAHVGCGYRGAFLHNLAQQIVSGVVDVESWRAPSSGELYEHIIELKGFGEYAAGSMMRLLGHHDRLGIDSVARARFARLYNHGEKATDAQIQMHYEPYGRWRGLLLWMDIIRDQKDGQ